MVKHACDTLLDFKLQTIRYLCQKWHEHWTTMWDLQLWGNRYTRLIYNFNWIHFHMNQIFFFGIQHSTFLKSIRTFFSSSIWWNSTSLVSLLSLQRWTSFYLIICILVFSWEQYFEKRSLHVMWVQSLVEHEHLHVHVNNPNDSKKKDILHFEHEVLCFNVLLCCDDVAMLKFFEMKCTHLISLCLLSNLRF